MASSIFFAPFQPYLYENSQAAVTSFQILGGECQIVQIMLKTGQKLTAKPGTMCYLSGSIQMENNYRPENEGGLRQWIFGRSVESVLLSNPSSERGFVGIAAPSLARIIPISLESFGGEILCQVDVFLCSLDDDVRVTSNAVVQRARRIEVGAEVILKQKIVGQGLAFLVGSGSVVQKILAPGEALTVDAASIVAMTRTINFELKYANGMRRMFLGGDNQLMASLSGPGVVFIQSLPFPRISQRVARAVAASSLRDNPKFFMQVALLFFLAHVMVVSSLILTDA